MKTLRCLLFWLVVGIILSLGFMISGMIANSFLSDTARELATDKVQMVYYEKTGKDASHLLFHFFPFLFIFFWFVSIIFSAVVFLFPLFWTFPRLFHKNSSPREIWLWRIINRYSLNLYQFSQDELSYLQECKNIRNKKKK
jgi:hypothetical protein